METKTKNAPESVDGRARYTLDCGVGAEDVIAEILERVHEASGSPAAAWDVANAIKYLLRIGRKDGWAVEVAKAENYLHHALTGEWL